LQEKAAAAPVAVADEARQRKIAQKAAIVQSIAELTAALAVLGAKAESGGIGTT
jgi:hypothetical protein